MWNMGTLDPFEAHDAAMNEKGAAGSHGAGSRRSRRPQIVSPAARFASESAEASANANVTGEITVKPAPGTTATATGKRSKVPLRVQPSGAF
jgi:hypothetical protein